MAMSSIEMKQIAPFARVADFVNDVVNRIKAWNAAEQARAELMAYTDYELSDLGLTRGQIADLDLSSPRKNF